MSAPAWEVFETSHAMFGVFNVEEPYGATLIAAFQSRLEAEIWIEFITQGATAPRARHSDADVRDTRFWQALPIRDVVGELWNSYEEVPGDA